MKKVTVRVPATSGNMGPAFDVLGVALRLYNRIELEIDRLRKNGKIEKLEIEIRGEGSDILPRNKNNLVYRSAKKVFDKLNIAPSLLRLKMHNDIPLAHGLGSSASAIVGGMKAANILSERKIKDKELLKMAVDMEGHPDNVVPAFYGGICFSMIEGGNLHFHKIPLPKEPFFVVAVPDFQISTKDARAVLPQKDKRVVKFRDHVEGMHAVAWLIAELFRKRQKGEKIILPVKDEWYHQPYRKKLIPGMEEVFRAAEDAGAFGAVLSGAGSSIIALVEKGKNWEEKGEKIGCAMDKAFARHTYKGRKITSEHMILKIDRGGCKKAK